VSKQEMPAGNLALIFCESSKKTGDNGFWVHTAGSAKGGDGKYISDASRNKGQPKIIIMNNLLNLGVVDSFHCHESINQDIVLQNKSLDEKHHKCWGRKVPLVIPNRVMNEQLWMSLLVKVIEVCF